MKKKGTKPETRGGARAGAGRKARPDKATTTFSFRAPISLLQSFKLNHGKGAGAELVRLMEADLKNTGWVE